TMGGVMFILGIVLAIVAGFTVYRLSTHTALGTRGDVVSARLFYGVMLAISYGLIGFVDDYIKVAKKQNEGLTASQKLMLQLLFGTIY
ncbi:MAG: phospho-N-acetylmuramoyl-pentapeptide-transferase, partial [Angelakisella sp.]